MKILILIIFGLFFVTLSNFKDISLSSQSFQNFERVTVSEIDTTFAVREVQYIENLDEYIEFTELLGFRESTNNYSAISFSGTFKGRYQFGPSALKDIGMDNISRQDFLNNPYYQELAMIRYLRQNRRYLSRYIERYNGMTINGIKITEPGILAGAHLVGHRGVKDFFRSNGNIIRRDGNNIPVTEYMKEFSKFDFKVNFEDTIISYLFQEAENYHYNTFKTYQLY